MLTERRSRAQSFLSEKRHGGTCDPASEATMAAIALSPWVTGKSRK